MAKRQQSTAEYLDLATAINVTGQEVTFYISTSAGQRQTRYVLPPGGTCQLQPGYCQPRETSKEGTFLPPIIVTRTNGQVVPIDSEEAQAFLAGQQGAKAKTDPKPEGRAAAR